MMRSPQSSFQTLKKCKEPKTESGKLFLKKKKNWITKYYLKTTKHLTKHSLNENSPKIMLKNKNYLLLYL